MLPSLNTGNEHKPLHKPLVEPRRAVSTFRQADFVRNNKKFRPKKNKKRKDQAPIHIDKLLNFYMVGVRSTQYAIPIS